MCLIFEKIILSKFHSNPTKSGTPLASYKLIITKHCFRYEIINLKFRSKKVFNLPSDCDFLCTRAKTSIICNNFFLRRLHCFVCSVCHTDAWEKTYHKTRIYTNFTHWAKFILTYRKYPKWIAKFKFKSS